MDNGQPLKEVKAILTDFERELGTGGLEQLPAQAQLIGYGEISAIFAIKEIEGWVFKRLPLFESPEQAAAYLENFNEYCNILAEAGLDLPKHYCHIIPKREQLFVLYIGQERFPDANLGHRRIHEQTEEENLDMLERIIYALHDLQVFNQNNKPALEAAIDGQLSNWVWLETKNGHRLVYIDTSTPLFKRAGKETHNPDLLLKSAPGPLQAIIKLFFLDDVMNRYYRHRDVYIDLAANLYKEQRPDLIPVFLEKINLYLPAGEAITPEAIRRYYREDKFIWQFFLAARRIDRWVKQKLLGRPYEFILPGPIKR